MRTLSAYIAVIALICSQSAHAQTNNKDYQIKINVITCPKTTTMEGKAYQLTEMNIHKKKYRLEPSELETVKIWEIPQTGEGHYIDCRYGKIYRRSISLREAKTCVADKKTLTLYCY